MAFWQISDQIRSIFHCEVSCRKSDKYLIIPFSYKDSASTPQDPRGKRDLGTPPLVGAPRATAGRTRSRPPTPGSRALGQRRSPGRRPGGGRGRQGPAPRPPGVAPLSPPAARGVSERALARVRGPGSGAPGRVAAEPWERPPPRRQGLPESRSH